ncbi:MAG: rhodanese-like domain-containing protein [Smithellaceae bacterium]
MNDLLHKTKSKIAVILRSAFKEALLLFLIAVLVAVVFNALRPAGISLLGFSPAQTLHVPQTKIPEITLAEAYQLYLKNKVVFVDARDPFSFEEGHIAGAINIYPDEISLHLAGLKRRISPGTVIITYCDGPRCPLSHETAQGLKLQGVSAVKVLIDGWGLWQKAGYPVAEGNK